MKQTVRQIGRHTAGRSRRHGGTGSSPAGGRRRRQRRAGPAAHAVIHLRQGRQRAVSAVEPAPGRPTGCRDGEAGSTTYGGPFRASPSHQRPSGSRLGGCAPPERANVYVHLGEVTHLALLEHVIDVVAALEVVVGLVHALQEALCLEAAHGLARSHLPLLPLGLALHGLAATAAGAREHVVTQRGTRHGARHGGAHGAEHARATRLLRGRRCLGRRICRRLCLHGLRRGGRAGLRGSRRLGRGEGRGASGGTRGAVVLAARETHDAV
mmetsp:Transcript_8361/g.24560  ORF Transcript_8361/g.24560 Transcript_8361/m.24560 type:complete len:268 (+) Transcript_8361:170-973(+)